MAIEHIFQFQARNASIRDVEKAVVDALVPVEPKLYHGSPVSEESMCVQTNALEVNINYMKHKINDRFSRFYYLTMFEIHYKFTPEFDIHFRSKGSGSKNFMIEETKVINNILKNFEGDAIYLRDVCFPRLWRRDGQLYLADNDDTWKDSYDFNMDTLFEMPYIYETMPDHFIV